MLYSRVSFHVESLALCPSSYEQEKGIQGTDTFTNKLDPELTELEIGLEAQWNHFEALQSVLDTPPVVVRAEDIRADTRGVIGALWEKTALGYRDEAFSWSDESLDDWKQVDGWHGSVSSSQSIRALTLDELAVQNEKFDICAREKPQLVDYLNHHMPFYNRLKEQALTSRQ